MTNFHTILIFLRLQKLNLLIINPSLFIFRETGLTPPPCFQTPIMRVRLFDHAYLCVFLH